jgi:hypothetical protein
MGDVERSAVEQQLEQHPELRSELNAIEEVQETLLMSAALAPTAEVKERLLISLDQSKTKKGSIALLYGKFAVAASLVLTIISSFLAYDYRDKWIKTVISFNDLQARNQQIAEDYNTVNNRIGQIEKDIAIVNNAAFTRVVMTGTANAPDAQAFVYWNERTREVYLSLQNMKELPLENQYQLWAIIDGRPVDAGVFDGNRAGLLKMKEIGIGAATFAVTIEPRGGKSSPSLETMQVVGKVVIG